MSLRAPASGLLAALSPYASIVAVSETGATRDITPTPSALDLFGTVENSGEPGLFVLTYTTIGDAGANESYAQYFCEP